MNKVLGVKVYDSHYCTDSYLDLMQESGINTVFLGRGALSRELCKNLTQIGLFWNIVEPVFLVTDDEPCILATKEDGEPASDDWVRFACPTDKDHMARVQSRIRDDIRTFNPPGVSFDFIRFFQFWEMTSPSSDPRKLPRTCYCPRCRNEASRFESEEKWRRSLITETAKNLSSLAKEESPSVRIGIHAVPWTKSLFDGARENVIGQDFCKLASLCDYLTPMAYHHMMHMDVSYIKDLLSDMAKEGCKHIVASVQSKEAYRTDTMDASEYEKALEYALSPNSEGVLVYKWEDLCTDKKRLGITKALFKGL